ncbi:MAG: DNA (cytosine-5-)-methyltransferase [Gemmataceae bacterium]
MQPDDLPGHPDLVFSPAPARLLRRRRTPGMAPMAAPRARLLLEQQFVGSSESDYWVRKVHRNIERDIRATGELLRSGWSVVRFWADAVEKAPQECAARVAAMLAGAERPSPFSAAATATTAEFFAGIGLMRLGLEQAGWHTVWANDHDPMKRAFYRHNLVDEEVTVDGRSIQDVPPRSVPRAGLISACFPCTDLSLAGAVRGLDAGPQSSAYLRFATILAELGARRPPFVILENVVGLIHSHAGKDFRLCLQRLADAGYRVDAVKIDAVHFVPQSRPRLFLMGVREDIALTPCRTPAEADELRPPQLLGFMREHADLPWGIRPLPPLPERTLTLTDILEDIDRADPVWWSAERVERLKNQVSRRHRALVDMLLEKEGVVWATAFRRMRHGRSMAELRFDGVAGCLRTPKGGSAKQILVRVDQEGWHVRLLTPRECARLMGAGDFRLDAPGTRGDDALFGFGDAVCVPAVEWLVRHYVNPLMAELLRGGLLAPE